jgi:hypothetical protein
MPASAAAAAAPATTASAVTAATAAAARALFTRTRFIHCQRATIEIFSIQSLDRGIGAFFGFHRYKGEAPRPAAEPVLDEIHFNDRAMRGEQVLKLILGCVEGKISYKQFGTHDDLFD